jgi:hypothetical protein
LIRQLRPGMTVQGLRSCFRDWAAGMTVIEESLAHSLSAVEAAYKRRPMLMRRRGLMADWATFLVRPCAEALAEWEKTLNAVPKREVLIRLSRVAMANPEPFIFPGDQTRDE